MFWVIFDTSARRNYYRDVHDLIALPAGATIRYDYNRIHISEDALAQLANEHRSTRALIVYAQLRTFRKGDQDPQGGLKRNNALWIGTRIVDLRNLWQRADRVFFDMVVGNYPVRDDNVLMNILGPLADAGAVPFEKWVTISQQDQSLDALDRQPAANNWASVVDALGTPPAQFVGDVFWRVTNVLRGAENSSVSPVYQPREELQNNQNVVIGTDAVFPLYELDQVTIEIESRTPGHHVEPPPQAGAPVRRITFAAPADSLLSGFNAQQLDLRRFAVERTSSNVGTTTALGIQRCQLRMSTVPDEGGFPVGPELSLEFSITKRPGRAYFSIILGIVAFVSGGIGLASVTNNVGLAIILLTVAALSGVTAFYLLTGRIRLPAK